MFTIANSVSPAAALRQNGIDPAAEILETLLGPHRA